ncbi:MAG TPA: M1 family metallopeptidase [Bryobacteraceae bacterium]|jgi:alanyl aminopeptidase|nr:M1 family metallopeptidase [Bryobacteraceae bacterium]
MRFSLALISLAALAAPVLPPSAVPVKYTVNLWIDPSRPVFEGEIRIDLDLGARLAEIPIEAKDITPLTAAVDGKPAKAEVVDPEFIAVTADPPAGPGRVTISVRYRGKLDENSVVGPYRKKAGGDWYAFTTFTPIDARRAFPCFDEPRFKARWDLTIHAPVGDKAVANGRALSDTREPNGMHATHFALTEPLPSEVVAFAVGPFDLFEGAPAGHGTPIRVITPRGLLEQGSAAAQASVDVLPRLEAYTGMPYRFGKLDHLALPEGAFGAVENPGLITYRQRGLLAAPGEDTPEKIRAIRSVEAHEMAHQWFGDLVTQADWDEVWLSEGFATWLSAKIMDQFQPPARARLASVAARERIMAMDDSPRTRPVRVIMHNREEMKNVYSQIVYQKGAAILWMVEEWLGEAKMQAGLRDYLKKHEFANATTADLESSLREAARIDPAPVMDSFLNQTGIPILQGEIRCDGQPRIEVRQTNEAHNWSIPVCWRGDGGSGCSVIDKPRAEIALKSCATWFYLNSGAAGYYRTAWTAEQAPMLESALPRLTAAERLLLAYDLRAAKVPAPALISKLSSDPEPEIAKAARDEK